MATSELLWKLADYRAARIEPPARLVSSPMLCEGDLMSQDEVDEFIKDSIATLRILYDKASPRWQPMVEIYRLDLAALLELGRIDEDEYNELIEEQNLHF
jgi:hypothetical protein